MDATSDKLLDVKDLSVAFKVGQNEILAVDRVSFDIGKGETVAIVGESGSGKSVTALSVLKLLPYPAARHPSGTVHFKGRELMGLSENDMRDVRGNDITIIFQEPMTSLNPLHTIEKQIGEILELHRGMGGQAARARTLELLTQVGIPEPETRLGSYPHQLSGGQRQRVMIAMALANEPDLLIADEPTTALDVTTQAQILNLMRKLQEEFDTAIIMITHDLGVVAEVADDVVVMYAGKIAEEGTVDEIFTRPHHPYTWGLLGSLPRIDADIERLVQIQGQPPSLLHPPAGCRFHPRCPYVMRVCTDVVPALLPVTGSPQHLQACHLDEATKDREVAKLLAGTLAEVP
jgi:microcin C transport system ATP-binding protein